jgi:alpha-amylase
VSGDRLAFCFGVHNHQPVGNLDHVIAAADERGYRPFLACLRRRPEIRATAHFTGSLLEWLRERSAATFDLLGEIAARGQVELLTGGFYEPILAILPDHDKLGQIERLTNFLKSNFGTRPRGMWLAERVWEPQLPKALREAGVEYVLVDDSHFTLAGLDSERLGGYYLTEEQGATVAVFPISQRLRYLIPFADVEETIAYLDDRRDAGTITMVDDGEKFGVWPGTYDHVYRDGWLDRFFDRVLGVPWLELTTLADVVDRYAAAGPVYLPTASYREMGEWALPTAAGDRLQAAKRELARLADGRGFQDLLRGGFWRSFLVKYPEIADTYWKMLRLSHALQQELARRPGDPRLLEALTALHRGQANDAYWHGVFGGCYLPHLRRGVKQALLQVERAIAAVGGGPPLAWARGDLNGDGREEIAVRTSDLVVRVHAALGGGVTEIGVLDRGIDLADVLARRREVYHAQLQEAPAAGAPEPVRTIHAPPAVKEAGLRELLQYDELRRASLLDGLFEGDDPLDAVSPWSAARLVGGRLRYETSVEEDGGGVVIRLGAAGADVPLHVDKRIAVRGDTLEARYRLSRKDSPRGRTRWAVQWNLALSSGDGPQRYLDLPERPAPRSRGARTGLSAVTLVDEWIGIEARLAWTPAAELAWGPVETVSVSEGGFERIYQGTAFLVVWDLAPADAWELGTTLQVRTR